LRASTSARSMGVGVTLSAIATHYSAPAPMRVS
jgi:hypothetical protein